MVPALVMQIPQHANIIPTCPSMEFFNRILHSPRILRERKIIAKEEKTQHVTRMAQVNQDSKLCI
jgi:hypothetical protein